MSGSTDGTWRCYDNRRGYKAICVRFIAHTFCGGVRVPNVTAWGNRGIRVHSINAAGTGSTSEKRFTTGSKPRKVTATLGVGSQYIAVMYRGDQRRRPVAGCSTTP